MASRGQISTGEPVGPEGVEIRNCEDVIGLQSGHTNEELYLTLPNAELMLEKFTRKIWRLFRGGGGESAIIKTFV